MSTATVPTKSVTADRFGAQHVVVIGSGLAGLTTALRLRRGGARTSSATPRIASRSPTRLSKNSRPNTPLIPTPRSALKP